jgi:hypothetical protein
MPHRTRFILFVAAVIALQSFAVNVADDKQHSTQNAAKRPSINSIRDLQGAFAEREVDVEILGMKTSDEFNRIHAKISQAMKDNAPWFLEYVKSNAEPGKPLPYHENFGVTSREYDSYHKSLKTLKFVPVAKGRIKFTPRPNDQVVIDGVGGLHEFDGTVIDFKQEQMVTSWGTVPLDKIVHVDEASALGSWDGCSGRLYSGNVESGNVLIIRIDIGRQSKTGLNFVGLSVRVAKDGMKTVNVETFVRFP